MRDDVGSSEESSDDYTIDMMNHLNIEYVGPLFIGTPMQGNKDSKFYYDTGTGTTLTTATGCDSGCASHYYNPLKSSTSQAVVNGTDTTVKTLKTGNIKGDWYKDKVCINEKLCVDDWGVFAGTAPSKPIEFDGVLGFSFINDTAGIHNTSFVQAL